MANAALFSASLLYLYSIFGVSFDVFASQLEIVAKLDKSGLIFFKQKAVLINILFGI